MNTILLPICIPSYNRPEQLSFLLKSVNAKPRDIEIVVGEDAAPKRLKVREEIERFRKDCIYPVRYYENDQNLGYDKNVRPLIEQAHGKFVLLMGDDDCFAPVFPRAGGIKTPTWISG